MVEWLEGEWKVPGHRVEAEHFMCSPKNTNSMISIAKYQCQEKMSAIGHVHVDHIVLYHMSIIFSRRRQLCEPPPATPHGATDLEMWKTHSFFSKENYLQILGFSTSTFVEHR